MNSELKRKHDDESTDSKIQKTTSEKPEEEDIVVCTCAANYEDGLMVQCEECLFWQHADCATGLENPTEEDVEKLEGYRCEFCIVEKSKKKKKRKDEKEKDYNPNSSESDGAESPESSESE